jgi:TolB protein
MSGRVCCGLAVAMLLAGATAVGDFENQSDVGSPHMAGSAEFRAGAYIVRGSGLNIWGTADAFHFVWKKTPGDVSLAADIEFEGEGVVAHRKAGLMVRQSLESGAPYADIMIHGDGLASLQYRETPGGVTKEIRATAKAPRAVRRERRGTQIVARAGAETLGPITLPLGDAAYAGLAVCSHDDAVLETAIFKHVAVK